MMSWPKMGINFSKKFNTFLEIKKKNVGTEFQGLWNKNVDTSLEMLYKIEFRPTSPTHFTQGTFEKITSGTEFSES